MKLIPHGNRVEPIIAPEDLPTMSGVQLAVLLIPGATTDDIPTINSFLDHYQTRATTS